LRSLGFVKRSRIIVERLDLSTGTRYDDIEGAIHVARYAIVRHLCRDRRVLDFACGQGYGAALMKRWGAASVTAIDGSAEAIEAARAAFSEVEVEYRQANAQSLVAEVEPGSIDLAVCIETIEHVPEPAALLRALRTLVAPDGAIVLTCPNDHWYFPSEHESNPFHVRKYSFEEFRSLCEAELGPADSWSIGTGLIGYATVPIADLDVAHQSRSQKALAEARGATLQIVPTTAARAPLPSTCAYFVGIWGAQVVPSSASGFAVSMDSLASALAGMPASSDEATLERRLTSLQADTYALLEGPVRRAVRVLNHEEPSDQAATAARDLLAVLEEENTLLRDRHAEVERQLTYTREQARGAARDAGLAIARISAAEDLSARWAEELTRERERATSLEARLGDAYRQLDDMRRRVRLRDREAALMAFRLEDLESALARKAILSDVGASPVTEAEQQAGSDAASVAQAMPRVHYRIYRRVKNLLPARMRASLGPRLAKWLPRP